MSNLHIPHDLGLHGLSGGKSMIKSVQTVAFTYGSAVTDYDVTITAVDTGYSVVIPEIRTTVVDGTLTMWRAYFYNTTTVRLSRHASGTGYEGRIHVIEYEPGVVKSLQRSNSQSVTTLPTDVTITSVDTTKSIIYTSHQHNMTTALDRAIAHLENATTLRIRGANLSNFVMAWTVVEFY